MSERLAFGNGASSGGGGIPSRVRVEGPASQPPARPAAAVAPRPERRDWAYTGLMAFTALLFLRPQDHMPALAMIPLAEIAALVGLGSMITGRLGRGLPVSRITPELIAVVALGVVILATAPFSIWMGGAVGTFRGLYSKIILIFLLMVNTLNSPKRLERFMWLIVGASMYIATRAVFDYVRGVNLIESGRVQGAIGGIFRNPNDLALNMVAVLPMTFMLAMRTSSAFRRVLTLGGGVIMIGAIIASHSRSGTVGLAMMTLLAAVMLVRRRPGLVFAVGLLLVLALPLAPASYWERISSITDESKDDTGSREARSILLRESWNAFVENPLTGVGAGQFRNYKPEGRVEAWRESHNVLLQVAADLGILGLAAFCFLIVRAAMARRQTVQLLRRAAGGTKKRRDGQETSEPAVVTREEALQLDAHSLAMAASVAGWFVCALFASVAYNWTFYYVLALAAAPREVLIDRLSGAAPHRARFSTPIVAQEARA